MPLIVDLSTLPEDGVSLQGDLPAEIFAFPPHDDAKPVSPLHYELEVQRFGSELLLRGDIQASFEFTCVVTLQRFADALREEIVLEIPADPRCDEGDVPMECKLNSPYLVLDKTTDTDLSSPPPPPADNRWSALDALSDLKDNH